MKLIVRAAEGTISKLWAVLDNCFLEQVASACPMGLALDEHQLSGRTTESSMEHRQLVTDFVGYLVVQSRL
jgi:hypothetical protein